MSDDLERTSMLLSAADKAALDELAHSRTAAVRRLLAEADIDHPALDDADPEDVCPECGRGVAMVVAGDAISVRAADADAVDYCRVDTAASWLYVHV